MMHIQWKADPQLSLSNTYLGLLLVSELSEYSGDGLTLGVPDRTQPVPSVRSDHEAGDVRNDEP